MNAPSLALQEVGEQWPLIRYLLEALEQLITHAQSRAQAAAEFLASP